MKNYTEERIIFVINLSGTLSIVVDKLADDYC